MFIVRYKSTFYWDYIGSPMPEFTKKFKTTEEARVYLADPEHEAVEVVEVIEGEFLPSVAVELNQYCAKKKK